MWKLMGMLDRLQHSCSDTERTIQGENLGGSSVYKFNNNTKYHTESHSCHLLQGKCSMNGALNTGFYGYLLNGQLNNNLI